MIGAAAVCDRLAARHAEWRERWAALHGQPPRLLFHYTDAGGLRGIVTSQPMWASNAFFLNDATELTYAARLLHEVIADLEGGNVSPSARIFLERGTSTLLDPSSGLSDVYVSCFCEEKDLLSQWRGYERDGGAYSIGMHAGMLSAQPPQPILLRRVVYDPALQKSLIEAAVRPALSDLAEIEAAESEEQAVAAVPHYLGYTRELIAECSFSFTRRSAKKRSGESSSFRIDPVSQTSRPSRRSFVPPRA